MNLEHGVLLAEFQVGLLTDYQAMEEVVHCVRCSENLSLDRLGIDQSWVVGPLIREFEECGDNFGGIVCCPPVLYNVVPRIDLLSTCT